MLLACCCLCHGLSAAHRQRRRLHRSIAASLPSPLHVATLSKLARLSKRPKLSPPAPARWTKLSRPRTVLPTCPQAIVTMVVVAVELGIRSSSGGQSLGSVVGGGAWPGRK